MDKQVRAHYTDVSHQTALERFAIDPVRITPLDAFESFVYTFTRTGDTDVSTSHGQEFVLRIGHSNRRREDLVLGEVDWLNYLAQHGALVAYAVPLVDLDFMTPAPLLNREPA